MYWSCFYNRGLKTVNLLRWRNNMTKHTIISHDRDTSSSRKEDREAQIANWSKEIAQTLAKNENIELTEEHWDVIHFLRNRYIEQGDPESARDVAEELELHFSDKGGNKFLRKIFPKGPVAQGSRIAGLPVPAYSEDTSFGTSY